MATAIKSPIRKVSRPVTRPRPIPNRRPTIRPLRPPVRPGAMLPKTVPFTAKPWVSVGTRLVGRLGLGVLGLVLTPTQLSDGTVQIVGRPEPRPGVSPWRKPVEFTFRPTHGTKDDRYVRTISLPKKELRSARLPDPAVKSSLAKAKAMQGYYRLPVRTIDAVVPTGMSDVLDAALQRRQSTRFNPVGDIQVEQSARQIAKQEEKRERKRKKRQRRRRLAEKPVVPGKPKPATPPAKAPVPAVKPAPSVPRPVVPAKPAPKPGRPAVPVKPTQPAGRPAVKPSTPVKVPTPVKPSQPTRPSQGVSPAQISAEVVSSPWKTGTVEEIVIDGRFDPQGVPRMRVRTRDVRAPRVPQREKDQKVRGTRGALLLHKFVTEAWGMASEVQDFWEVFRGNLYAEFKGGIVYAEDLRLSDQAIMAHFIIGDLKLDVDAFIRDFAVNQIEDAVIGHLAGALTKSIIRAGGDPGPITATQTIGWLRRTRIQGDM